jgi:hypothetical protein
MLLKRDSDPHGRTRSRKSSCETKYQSQAPVSMQFSQELSSVLVDVFGIAKMAHILIDESVPPDEKSGLFSGEV